MSNADFTLDQQISFLDAYIMRDTVEMTSLNPFIKAFEKTPDFSQGMNHSL